MKKYSVGIAVKGRVYVEVDAESFEDAKKKACDKVYDLDFGALECIDWSAVYAENETGARQDF